jgi:hypothetical protein
MRSVCSVRVCTRQTGVAAALAVILVLQPFLALRRAEAQVPLVGLAALSGALDQLSDRLKGIINSAASQADGVIITLGAQIATQIAIAQNMLHTELEYQRKAVEEAVNEMIDKIRTAIDDLERRAFNEIHDLTDQVQLIAMSLPFMNRTPTLRSVQPAVAFPTGAESDVFVFRVAGNFPDVALDGYKPSLEFQLIDSSGTSRTATVPARQATNLAAEFPFTEGQLFSSQTRRLQGTVRIPYRHRCWLFFHCRVKPDATFPISVGLLPRNPGRIKLHFTDTYEDYETKHKESVVLEQDASDGDIKRRPQTVQPDSGYQVIPESVRISVVGARGDTSLGGNCSSTLSACWQVTTVQHHCIFGVCPQGGDGYIWFKLSFDQKKLKTFAPAGDVNVAIDWNRVTVHTFTQPRGVLSWSAVYTDFANNDRAFGSQNTAVDSPYLKVSKVADNTWAFGVYPFGAQAGADVTGRANPTTSDPSRDTRLGILMADIENLVHANTNPLRPAGFRMLKESAATSLRRALLDETLETLSRDIANVNQSSFTNASRSNQPSTTPAPPPITETQVRNARDAAARSLNAAVNANNALP